MLRGGAREKIRIVLSTIFVLVLAIVAVFYYLMEKLENIFREKRLRDIVDSSEIKIHGLKFPSWIVTKKKSSSLVYYCNICYVTAEKPGKCNEHEFPNTLTLGSTDQLEYYNKMNKLYEAEDGDLSAY